MDELNNKIDEVNSHLKPEDAKKIQLELDETKKQLTAAHQNKLVYQQNPQDKFIETLFDKGGDMLKLYLEVSSETQKYTLEKETEYEKEQLKIVDSLDKRDKYFKGLLLSICITALGLLAYFEKAQSVAPVIGVVIGLLLKSSSITEFFSSDKLKGSSPEKEN